MFSHLSDNYHLRKYYIQQEQVPTQSMIRKKMTPALAAVYFKSMTPRLKEIVGLEPSLRGGGNDWYVPPKDILEGRYVLKPVSKELLKNLTHMGIDEIGIELFKKHRKRMDLEIENALIESDVNWRNTVTDLSNQTREHHTAHAKIKNTEHITNAFNYFTHLYRLSLQKTESLFHEAAIAEIKKTREKALHWMQNNYAAALQSQATMLYDVYEKKLMEEKARIKAKFIKKLEINRSQIGDTIHDLYVDKHMAIEKLRQFLESQTLACQIYVALKEREECMKELEESRYKHLKDVKKLNEELAYKHFEINIAEQKLKRQDEFSNIWQKKVCHVVKKFQTFVSYCLNMLPEHADFFINMEKLMLLQVNETLENPSAESIIITEEEKFHTPVPRPKPFYLFCDRGYKAIVDEHLCRPRSDTHLPVIIINKRCLYGACDNFEQFTDKVKGFIYGERGDEAATRDDQLYEHYVPVKYTSSRQLLELKLESSLIQVLQQELPHTMREDVNDIPVKCGVCGFRHCMCSPWDVPPKPLGVKDKVKQPSLLTTTPTTTPEKSLSKMQIMELVHETEPKWESYFQYIEPKKCNCAKKAKKHLVEHLPPYMKHMKYGPPEIPYYETCSVTTLKTLVKEARKQAPPVPVVVKPSKTKDEGTQYFDPEFEFLCTCFTDDEVCKLLSSITIDPTALVSTWASDSRVVGADVSATYMTKEVDSFATARAYSLRNIVKDVPELQEIFKKQDCT